MAFNELIKDFDKLRDYMRDFLVYGYKTRADYAQKSKRTYDNERRRIESYLGPYIKWEYGKNGKRVFLSVDSARILQNPLYRAYQSKSFTDYDITLHFLILDLLESAPPMTASQISDALSFHYGEPFEAQTVRNKLIEYVQAGILVAQRQGRFVVYTKNSIDFQTLFPDREEARDFLSFFGETIPFSVVGSYLAAHGHLQNIHLLFKHHFIVHTLEDKILLPLINAIKEHRFIEFENFSNKSGVLTHVMGLPVVILVSVQTGRRYLVLFGGRARRFHSFRLDNIKTVKLLDICGDAESILQNAATCLSNTWGASITGKEKTEHFEMDLCFDPRTEPHILARLRREGRMGTLEQIGEQQFRWSVDVTDSGELMCWVKTFTGRVLDVRGDNKNVVARFFYDMRRMKKMYEEVL